MRTARLLVTLVTLAASAWAASQEVEFKTDAEVTTPPPSPTAQRLAANQPKLFSRTEADRQKAYQAYLDAGDEGRQLLSDALLPCRTEQISKCTAFALTEAAQKKLLKAHTMLAEARKEALRVIFDRKIYPDANHGRAGQPIVDAAVNKVKEIHPHHQALFDPVLQGFALLRRIHGRIVEIDKQLLLCKTEDVELEPALGSLVSGVPAELVAILTAEADFRDYCERCLRYNRTVRTTASAGERKVVELTNEYRMQLGIKPLAINEQLTQAARKHSAEMSALGYFGHTSPKPERRGPGQRCTLEGYNHYSGENCASGAGAEGAFRMWYNSSGHHRNMIHPANNEIGVGYAGPWTEDFGRRRGLDLGRLPEPKLPTKKVKPEKKPLPWEKLFPTDVR